MGLATHPMLLAGRLARDPQVQRCFLSSCSTSGSWRALQPPGGLVPILNQRKRLMVVAMSTLLRVLGEPSGFQLP